MISNPATFNIISRLFYHLPPFKKIKKGEKHIQYKLSIQVNFPHLFVFCAPSIPIPLSGHEGDCGGGPCPLNAFIPIPTS